MTSPPHFLRHPLLEEWGVEHGFGTRDALEPAGAVRPTQVHGSVVARVDDHGQVRPEEADAVLATAPGIAVAVVTADCVPILAAAEGGSSVVAIHAGWRGLAAGVVGSGIDALRSSSPRQAGLRAVVGPHIGRCCYEVDAPVTDSLRRRFGDEVTTATRSSRPGHHLLDLAYLVQVELRRHGIDRESSGEIENACTRCDDVRFHSYRRDGPGAGRLLHFIQAALCED